MAAPLKVHASFFGSVTRLDVLTHKEVMAVAGVCVTDRFVVEPMENALLEKDDEEGDGEGDESDGISDVSEVCAYLLVVHVLH